MLRIRRLSALAGGAIFQTLVNRRRRNRTDHAWRSDLAKIERPDGTQFLKYPKSGATTLFRITQTQFLPTRCFAQNALARQAADKPNAFQVAFLWATSARSTADTARQFFRLPSSPKGGMNRFSGSLYAA